MGQDIRYSHGPKDSKCSYGAEMLSPNFRLGISHTKVLKMGSEKLAFYMYGKTINNLSKRETLILG